MLHAEIADKRKSQAAVAAKNSPSLHFVAAILAARGAFTTPNTDALK